MFPRTLMQEVKLFLTGLIIFTVTLLSGVPKEPYPSQPKLKEPVFRQLKPKQCNQYKPLTKCEEEKLIACDATIIPHIWVIHYRCSGNGFGGGGGSAF